MTATAQDDYRGRVFSYLRGIAPYCKWRNLAIFSFEAFTQRALYAEWFDFLESGWLQGAPPETANLLTSNTVRRYLRGWFRAADIIAILRRNHELLNARLGRNLLARMWVEPGVTLATLVGKTGRAYQIKVMQQPLKEGELIFSFWDPEVAAPLAVIRGSLGPDPNGKTVFWLGGIQGTRLEAARAAINVATRELNVLRPKHALFEAVCAFCLWLDVDTIHAPPFVNHISYLWYRADLARQKILSDYDGFWSEFTNARSARKDFVIALPLARRSVEEVKQKRRKDWLARHQRIDDLARQTVSTLDSQRRADD